MNFKYYGAFKRMNYAEKKFRSPLVLVHDWYMDYEYYILNLGTHPTAYVVLEKEDKLFNKPYMDLDWIECHGGLTYSETYLIEEYNCNKKHFYFVKDKWVLGWDYNHAGDYSGYVWNDSHSKKWTTEEMVDHAQYVIDQIVEYNNEEWKK